jgi:NDP-sugar pyrophosphorylase family protein
MGDTTKNVQKTMIDINGKPVLQHQVEFLKRNGIKDIIFSIGYLGDQVKKFFGDGSKFGVNIDYVVENEPLGTAGPLRLAKAMLDDTFVMINGDTLIDVRISEIVDFHKEQNVLATIMLVESDETKSRGVAKMEGDKIVDFMEKPDADSRNLINGGLYVLEPGVTLMVPEGYCMIEKDIFPQLAKIGKLAGWTGRAKIMDMGTPERLEKTIKEWRPEL